MIDQALIDWVEKQYRIKCPRIIYTRHFPGPGVDAFYCSGGEVPRMTPIIVIWEGAEDPEYLFLHELQHHIRRELEKKESPDLKERWADYLAQCDLISYLTEKESKVETNSSELNLLSGVS